LSPAFHGIRAALPQMLQRNSKIRLVAEKQPSQEFALPNRLVVQPSSYARMIRGVGLPVDGGWTAQ
jgi:hypothetical protein